MVMRTSYFVMSGRAVWTALAGLGNSDPPKTIIAFRSRVDVLSGGMREPAETMAPAPMIEPRPTTAPSSTVACTVR